MIGIGQHGIVLSWRVFFAAATVVLFTTVNAAASVMVVPIEKVIDGGLAEFVHRAITEAEDARSDGIVFHVDTPGGRIDSAVDIKDAILKTSIPTTAFVDRNAISAGSLISLACDSIYMSTGASIGAATAVDLEGRKATEKIISYFRAQMRATAEANGRRADIAEAMVDEEIAIDGITEKGKLLTLTYSEALDLGISDGTVDTLDGVLARLGMSGSAIERMKPNWAENLVRLFTHPVVSSLLMSIGFLGLLIELRTPGWGIPGTLGLIALMLFFGSHYIVRLVGVGELILFAAGIILLTLEVFVIPGFGITGVSGIALIVISLYLSLIGRVPYPGDYRVAAYTFAGAIALMFVGAALVVWLFPYTPFYGKLVLQESEHASQGFSSARTESELLGMTGMTLSDLRPSGKAEFGGRRIDVVTEGDYIEKGTPVTVDSVSGARVVVRKIPKSS